MNPQGLLPVEVRIGTWTVEWRPGDFFIPDIGSFSFKKIVLPFEIVGDVPHDSGYVVVKLEHGFRFEILQGTHLKELEAFKRRGSAETLSASRGTSYCFDCARDAGMIPTSWSGSDCPGCRRPYCRNPFCLRRLESGVARDGLSMCRSCRVSSELVGDR